MTEQLFSRLPESPALRFRAQMLMYILVTVLAVDVLIFLVFLFVAPLFMEAHTRAFSLVLIGSGIAVELALLLGLLRGHLRLATTGFMVVTCTGLALAILFTGGAPDSPALPLLLVPAVLSFCLLGAPYGLAFVVLAPLFILLQMYAVAHWGLELPRWQSRTNPQADAFLIGSFNFFVVIAVLLVYERINAQLRAERDADRQRLATLATLDDLTGLGNRRYFHQRLAEACARCDRGHHQLAVLYIDLNGFKPVNDAYGHETGDQLLVEVGRRLRGLLRAEDFVARLGGDEFAVILEPVQSRDGVAEVQEKLRQQISQPVEVNGRALSVGASIGVALYPADASRAEQLMRQADAAMYREKHSRHAG